MRILALIPARGGSKRVPNKNIRPLGGKPLIEWSIDSVREVPEIVDTLVSTDSLAIAEIARAAGALVPWLRPHELSTDTATSMAVCLHALDWYEQACGKIDGLLLLQPTSPFRSTETIKSGIRLFAKHGGRPVVSFSPAESHPMWCYRQEDDRMLPFVDGDDRPTRSQDLMPAYVINGELYLATPSHLRTSGGFITGNTVPLLVEDRREALDIDTEWDWSLAEGLLVRGAPGAPSSPATHDGTL